MLSQSTISTVKSTAPLIAQHGHDITHNFYLRLFDDNPELFNIFNRPNQTSGQQQNALAEAVFAYASHIDNLSALESAIERITHKHNSIGVTAEHYPVVGKHLIDAVKEVLSLPSDHEAITAWEEAYNFLAHAFITQENFLSNKNIKSLNWSGFKPFIITKCHRETPEVLSLWLKPVDETIKIDYQAGQYISVRIPDIDNGYDQIRQYSISSWDEYKKEIRITVKTESHGRVSPFINMLEAGKELQISPPQGVFILNTQVKSHAFISAGVGITPLFAMLKEAVEKHKVSGNKLTFIQCSRSQAFQIYQKELSHYCNAHDITLKQIYELDNHGDHQGYITKKQLEDWIDTENSDVYYCGPKPFMSQLNLALSKLDIGEERQHYEIFGPTTALKK